MNATRQLFFELATEAAFGKSGKELMLRIAAERGLP
jgi:hypothetical protein